MSRYRLPLVPRRVLVGANAHAEMIRWIAARRGDLEFRGARLAEVTEDDLRWADTYVGFRRPMALPDLGSVQWVHCTGAGVDAWLYPNEMPGDVLLTRTPEPFGPAIAEWVIGRMLAFAQHLLPLAAAQSKREWASLEPQRLAGSRVLVVGMGDVGRAVTHHLQAFDCEVTGVSRSGQSDSPILRAIHPASALPDLVADAQWIVLTIPLTKETDGLFSREVMARCRGAVLLNVGRGGVVDESSLPAALDAGWISGAALDVFAREPLPVESPLWAYSQVMISPHNSGPTTVEGAGEGFLECAAALQRGVLPRWAVDRSRGY